MKLENNVLFAIDDYEMKKLDSSLMHACFAIEATARNLYSMRNVTNKEYKRCIRDYIWIIEAMIGGGLNLEETPWKNLRENFRCYKENGRPIENPDLADVIYYIFRCNNAHGKEVPINYQILPCEDGRSGWIIADGVLQMPERIIWALLAISVFSKANNNIKTSGNHYLTWGSESLGLGTKKFIIKDWWGREDDFKDFISKQNIIRVKLEL